MTNDFYWPPLDDRERSIGRSARSIACLGYSAIAYVLFLGTIAYFFLFVAGVVVPKTVDRGSGPLGPALLIDVLLILGFGVQHSIMARSAVKRRLTRLVPEPLERSTFVLLSALVLVFVFWLWRPIPAILWSFSSEWATFVRALGVAGVLLAVASTFALSHSTLFGLQQPYRHVRGLAPAISSMRLPLLYRVVRHPMHLGMLLAIWAAPVMTAGHLLFAMGMSAYVLIGIHFEERDLVRTLGDAYRAYRMEVPALMPFLRPRAWSALIRRPLSTAMGIAVITLALLVLGGARHQGSAPGPEPELQELPRDSVAVRGQMRRFGYYVSSRARAGAPIVIALHGTGGTGERLRRFTGGWLDSLAERHGFVVAYPDAVEGTWNTCRAAESAIASRRGVDDVAMVSAVAGRLAHSFGADSTRVFALGYSGGGHLAYRLALEGPEVIRGVAIFAANLPIESQLACRPSWDAVPVMIVNGTADAINPYEGGAVIGPFGQRLGDVRSATATAAYFATRAGAHTTDGDVTPGVVVSGHEWTGAGVARVALYAVNGGGHSIPGPHSRFPSLVGPTERSWGGIEEAVRFFGIGGTP